MKAWQDRHAMMLLNGYHSGILCHSMLNGFSGYTVCLSYCQKPTGWIDRMCHLKATFIEDECYSGWKQILFSCFLWSWVHFEAEQRKRCFPFCCHCCSFITTEFKWWASCSGWKSPVIFSKPGITSWNKMLLFTMCVNGKTELLPSHAWTKINLSIYYVLTFTTADFIGCGK